MPPKDVWLELYLRLEVVPSSNPCTVTCTTRMRIGMSSLGRRELGEKKGGKTWRETCWKGRLEETVTSKLWTFDRTRTRTHLRCYIHMICHINKYGRDKHLSIHFPVLYIFWLSTFSLVIQFNASKVQRHQQDHREAAAAYGISFLGWKGQDVFTLFPLKVWDIVFFLDFSLRISQEYTRVIRFVISELLHIIDF